MNLTSLLAAWYRSFDYTGSSIPAAVTTRGTYYINEAHRELLALPGVDHVRDDVMAITAYNGIARTGLPPVVARIYAITDRTNNYKLQSVPLRELRITDPGQASTGSYPMRYAVIGNQAVYRQPGGATPAAGGLWVASSSASDITQKAYVESVVTGGLPNFYITGGTAIAGTTRVAIGSLTTHLEVTKFYVDAVGVGKISLYDAAAAGNELAAIPIGLTNSRYQAIEWWPIQQQDTTEYIDYQREIYDLVNGTDEPLLPPDFHPLVGLGARLREYESIDDTRKVGVAQEYERGKMHLRNYVMNNGDKLLSLRPVPLRWSMLGGTYPPDRIW